MLGSIIRRELANKKGQFLVVVTKDGWGFSGTLQEFDEDSLMLDNVKETRLSDAKPGFQLSWAKSSITQGMTPVTTPTRLVVRIDSISRLWV